MKRKLSETPEPPKTPKTVTGVIVYADLSKPLKTVTVPVGYADKVSALRDVIGGDSEAHVTAWNVRSTLPSEFQDLHEELIFFCDETGFYKPLPLNLRASCISGLRMLGTNVFFRESCNGEGEPIYTDLSIADFEALWEETK
jgi:hypothetical protein